MILLIQVIHTNFLLAATVKILFKSEEASKSVV